jgi:hypothetical protein
MGSAEEPDENPSDATIRAAEPILALKRQSPERERSPLRPGRSFASGDALSVLA